MKTLMSLIALALLSAAPLCAEQTNRQVALIAVLESAAPPAEKAITCKRLAIYGDAAAVPALARLLDDPQLASWSRIALEAIPDAAAADALRAAAGRLSGSLQVGAINSLGARRDAASVPALVQLLGASASDTAAAAAIALGRIGGPAAVAALSPRLADAAPALRPAFAEACLLCAARAREAGDLSTAIPLFESVRNLAPSVPLTSEATRGLVLARGEAGIPLLLEQLRSPEKAFHQLGLRLARELPGDAVTRALLQELPALPAARQPSLMLALGDRSDRQVLSAARPALRAESPRLRAAAVTVVEQLRDADSLPALLHAADDPDAAVASAARTALVRWPDAAVDRALQNALADARPESRLLAIGLTAQRGTREAVPALVAGMDDAVAAVRAAALKGLGELGGESELNALTARLLTAEDPAPVEAALRAICARSARVVADRVAVRKASYGDLPAGPQADVTVKVRRMVKAGENAIAASNASFGDPAGGRVKKLTVEYVVDGVPAVQTVAEGETLVLSASVAPASVVDPLCAALTGAQKPARIALLRVLRAAGGPKALEAIRSAARDADAEVRDTGLRLLCDWPTADAQPDLLQLVNTSSDAKVKTLALRGAIRLAQLPDVPAGDRFATLRGLMAKAERVDERRLILGALGGISSPEALAWVVSYLSDAELREEAAQGAVAIGEKLPKPLPEAAADAMTKVATSTANPELQTRAKALAGR